MLRSLSRSAAIAFRSVAVAFSVLVVVSAAPIRAAGKDQRRVDIKVTDAGFEPRQVKAKVGEPVTLAFTRTSDRTCMTAVDIPDEDVKQLELPLNRTVTVTITPKKKGTERFHCSAMGMGNGRIVVE